MSWAKMVEAELKMEVNEDMSAASMTASIRPRRPTGISSFTSMMNALLLQPDLSWEVESISEKYCRFRTAYVRLAAYFA